jgi:hypothetical protein
MRLQPCRSTCGSFDEEATHFSLFILTKTANTLNQTLRLEKNWIQIKNSRYLKSVNGKMTFGDGLFYLHLNR